MTDFLFGTLLLGPPLVTGVLAMHGLMRGSYLRASARPEMKFLAPYSVVVFPVTILAWIFWWCTSPISLRLLESGWRNILMDSQATEWLIISGALLAGLYWTVLGWYVKKCPLVLNIERRSYRIPDSSTISLKVQTGSWDEINGISVRRTHAKGTTTFIVNLEWQKPRQSASLMGGFSRREKAEAFAEQMARETGLPAVAAILTRL